MNDFILKINQTTSSNCWISSPWVKHGIEKEVHLKPARYVG